MLGAADPPGPRLGELCDLVEEQQLDALEAWGGAEGLAARLGTDLDRGVEGQQKRLELQGRYGRNVYPDPPTKGLWAYVKDACQDTTLCILALCGIASLVNIVSEGAETGWYDGVSIFGAVLVVIGVTAGNDYQQALQFQKLEDKNKEVTVEVVRDGRQASVSMYDVVVGDVLVLATGDQVCADGVCAQSASLQMDESSMTGESDLVRKDPSGRPFMLCGTKVADGYGRMLVTGVGMNTEWGRMMGDGADPDTVEASIARLEQKFEDGEIDEEAFIEKKEELQNEVEDSHETPLQVRLTGLSTTIGKFGMAVAVLVFVILIAKWLIATEGGKLADKSDWGTIVHYLSIAVSIVVVAVPEGLPLAVTLSLAYSMMKMYKDNSLVRHLKACEAMGGATTICSDKTGTLTLNQMTVVQSFVGREAQGADGDSRVDASWVPQDARERFFQSIFLNCEGQVFRDEAGKATASGKPTEKAILMHGLAAGGDSAAETARAGVEVLKVDPFSSAKKRMGVIVRQGGRMAVYWKGASEIVLGQCTHFFEDGKAQAMDGDVRAEFDLVIQQMANSALRTIGLAYRELPAGATFDPEEDEIPDGELVFLGVLGIKDPCRPEVPDSVARCQSAGIVVRMVTGDNIHTAKAIAKECKILTAGGLCVEGPEFRNMSNSQRMERFGARLEKLQVMARSSPTDKYDLVRMLRSLGEVVAVTGDGTNDSKALKEADVGLAMGIAGTEVAKKSSDIVIMDDNFQSIVTVVRWGRSVYSNIQKFLVFQLTVNVVALTLNFVSAVVPDVHPPLNAVQLLWVNMIMDSMGALALATEPPTEELMRQKPYGRTDPLLTPVMWRNILGHAVLQLIILFTLLFKGAELFGLDPVPHGLSEKEKMKSEPVVYLNSLIFNTFVFAQVFNELNARNLTKLNFLAGIQHNRLFIVILAVTSVLQVVLVEYCGTFAGTTSMTARHWGVTVGIGALSLPWGVIIKLFPVFDKSPFQIWSESRGLDKLGTKETQLADRLAQMEAANARALERIDTLEAALRAQLAASGGKAK